MKILRPQEIPILVQEGFFDIGITGLDWVLETNSKVKILQKLNYGRVKLIMATSSRFSFNSVEELLETMIVNKGFISISTEYLNLASRYISSFGKYKDFCGEEHPTILTPWISRKGCDKVKIFLSFGATEAKPPEEADVIFDNMSTGITLFQNNLKIIGEYMDSEAVLIANRDALLDGRREKVLDIKTILKGVVDAKERLHIFVNVKENNLEKLLAKLPALKSPTISPLKDKGWYSINSVIRKEDFFKIVRDLRKLAQGLVIYEPKQVLLLESDTYENNG